MTIIVNSLNSIDLYLDEKLWKDTFGQTDGQKKLAYIGVEVLKAKYN